MVKNRQLDKREKLLYEIVEMHTENAYSAVIQDYEDDFLLYHLSHIRSNILECIDWSDDMNVLEIAGEYGAMTGTIAGKVDSLTCIVKNSKEKILNEERHKEHMNITYMTGNPKKVLSQLTQRYDVIVSVVDTGMSLQEILGQARRLLNENGTLLFACRNKLGMRYWAGCQYEPEGGLFSGIEGSGDNNLYTKKELEDIMTSQRGWSYQMYFPYPDQYYSMNIYSQQYLPKLGELNANSIISKNRRLALFNEEKAYDTILKEGLFGEFSNAFLLVAERG